MDKNVVFGLGNIVENLQLTLPSVRSSRTVEVSQLFPNGHQKAIDLEELERTKKTYI